ncbi:receptor protein kinase-like protein ZAR1 isoform X2 [Rutidosis leptorrhynchoides]|uniref:receptor protein kinase-like protein ZAR1 isoform X2 n=1 Tax=Rutidosis leptorrhynchoides TaxID=125765 RepID=UPI003A998B46
MIWLYIHYITFSVSISISSSLNSDGLSLLALKAAVTRDPTKTLTTWSETDATPCHWTGVSCNSDHRVTTVFLPNKSLSGYIPSELGALIFLRHLSLSNNNFSKPIPDHLFNATNLLSIDLSGNSLAGALPENINNVKGLTFLDLSSNLLSGYLPESLSNLTNLAGTVNLSFNQFSGEIPASYGLFPVIVSLDLRYNNLSGKIPLVGSLLNQGPTAFTGNPYLCGFPLTTQCSDPEAQNPRILSNPDTPKDPGLSTGLSGKPNSGSVTVPLISGAIVLIGVLFISMWVYKKKCKFNEGIKVGKKEIEKEQINVIVNDHEGQDGKFVVMDEGFSLELEDLLRASAYVVGKSKNGIVYKVVAGLGSGAAVGVVVAVRRLSEGDGVWRLKEFEAEVESIGRVQHPNIVRLRAYYYANDEKLLVSDFISNGSLYSMLHGGPANPLPPLSWASRLKIAQGTARGLAHIHECSPRKHVHGNIKSSKILLDDDLQPFISGFGLNRLVSSTISKSTSRKLNNSSQLTITSSKNSSSSSSSNVHYVAPEVRISGQKLGPKCDVYSFGIVLLEMLTGRAPDGDGLDNNGKGLESFVRKVFRDERPLSEVIDPVLLQEVHAKKQVLAAFHIALNCTEIDHEVRPKMRMVSDSLDRIKLQ